MQIFLPDAEATRSLGVSLGQSLKPGSTILLLGDLGSGKTTLVQGIGIGLGISEQIVSPTFTIINEYIGGRIPLYHIDLYRLELAEIAALDLEIYWEGIEVLPGVVAIEWSERLQYKPNKYLSMQLSYSPENGRKVDLVAIGGFDLGAIAF